MGDLEEQGVVKPSQCAERSPALHLSELQPSRPKKQSYNRLWGSKGLRSRPESSLKRDLAVYRPLVSLETRACFANIATWAKYVGFGTGWADPAH